MGKKDENIIGGPVPDDSTLYGVGQTAADPDLYGGSCTPIRGMVYNSALFGVAQLKSEGDAHHYDQNAAADNTHFTTRVLEPEQEECAFGDGSLLERLQEATNDIAECSYNFECYYEIPGDVSKELHDLICEAINQLKTRG